MSTPTPRTDAAWSALFEGKQLSAGQTARALRECSQQLERELATLTAERDQLRAEVGRLIDIINRFSVQFFHDGTNGETASKMLAILNEAKP